MMDNLLKDLDRAQIIKATAIYFVVYAVVNVCGGLVFTFLGLLAGLAGVGTVAIASQSGMSSIEGGQELAQGGGQLVAMGGLVIVMGILYFVSIPIFAVAAFGLFQRKAWARPATLVAGGMSVLLSVIGLTNSVGNILWIALSIVVLYLFYTDEGIKQELSA